MEIRVGGRWNYNWNAGQLDYDSIERKKARGTEGRRINDVIKFSIDVKRQFQ